MSLYAPKNVALAGCTLIVAMGFSQPALAYSPAGFVPAGPGLAELVLGQPATCATTLVFNVTPAGNATLSNVSFNPPPINPCAMMVANGLPWTVGTATPVSFGANVFQMTIGGISVSVYQPSGALIATCAGSVTARLDQNFTPHRLTFAGTLHTTAPVVGASCIYRSQPGAYLATNLGAP